MKLAFGSKGGYVRVVSSGRKKSWGNSASCGVYEVREAASTVTGRLAGNVDVKADYGMVIRPSGGQTLTAFDL